MRMQNYISEIQIIPIKPQNGLVAFASFVLNDCFRMSSIGISPRTSGGYRLIYPTQKNLTLGLNVFYPIKKEIAQQVELEVITKYEQITQESNYFEVKAELISRKIPNV